MGTGRLSSPRDLWAGLALAGLVLPEAIAYAGIANLPPVAGLMSACVGLLIYALLGRSRYAVLAATSSSAAVLAAAVQSFQPASAEHALALAAGLVMMTGTLFLLCSLLGLGRMAQFIARPVVRGLALGIALIVAIRQLAQMLALQPTHTSAVPLLFEILQRHDEWNLRALGLGIGALLFLQLLRRWPRLPAALLLLVASLVVTQLWPDLRSGVPDIGELSIGSIRAHWPVLGSGEWLRLAELSVALMLVLFAESYSSIRTFSLDEDVRPDTNRELLALGCGNLVAGLFGGAPVGAGYSATAANRSFGARSRAAGLVTALSLPLLVWGALPYVQLIALPVLAAIVLHALRHSLDLEPLQRYLGWKRDRLVVAVAVVGTLALGALDGLLVSIALSLIVMIRDFARPRLSRLGRVGATHDFIALGRHPEAREIPGALILRPEAPLFFGNVDSVLDEAETQLATAPQTRVLVLSLEESPDVDGTVIEVLAQFAARVHRSGVLLRLARLKDPAAQVLLAAHLPTLPAEMLSTGSVDAVIGAAQASLLMRSGAGGG